MIFAGFNLVKFLFGFNIFNGEKLGKLLYQIIIISLCLFIFWAIFIKKAIMTKTTQKAQTITNITEIKEESAFELVLVPPKIKLGSFKIKLFQDK